MSPRFWMPAYAGMTTGIVLCKKDVVMHRFKLLFVVIFCCSHVYAGKVNEQIGYTQGFIPGAQVAAKDDAWSLFLNPSGIGFVGGAQLVGGYEYQSLENVDFHHAQGIFAVNPFAGLSLGI